MLQSAATLDYVKDEKTCKSPIPGTSNCTLTHLLPSEGCVLETMTSKLDDCVLFCPSDVLQRILLSSESG